MFAVVRIAGFQELVQEGQVLQIPLRKEKNDDTIRFDQVLLSGNGDTVKFGAPYLQGATIEAQVLRHGKADKIRVVKAHRRKRYRRVHGHRQNFTEVKITKISA